MGPLVVFLYNEARTSELKCAHIIISDLFDGNFFSASTTTTTMLTQNGRSVFKIHILFCYLLDLARMACQQVSSKDDLLGICSCHTWQEKPHITIGGLVLQHYVKRFPGSASQLQRTQSFVRGPCTPPNEVIPSSLIS
ncbi:hypothetical protein Fot_28672 [Forsythia ovata]|uniref:Uncharacterized protein n=1 Tax=Forsythia ovata TaxID=205694 RepID=A0ABD1TPP6_9LAMI